MFNDQPNGSMGSVGRLLAAALLLGAVGSTGCVESTVEPDFVRDLASDSATTRTGDQTVEVNTRFVIDGLDEIANRVQLDRLFVHVGAIVLEPIGDEQGVSFASREPFALDFDVAAGERALSGPTMALPYGGEFAVVVQVEPTEVSRGDNKTSTDDSSVEVDGRWFYAADFDGVAPRSDEPSPLPWREPSNKGNSTDRTLLQQQDFSYRAADVARLHLTEIRLDDAGEYELTLTLRVDGWLENDVLPVLVELASSAEPVPTGAEVPEFLPVDDEDEGIDPVIDSTSVALDGLVGDIEASTARR